MMKLNEQGYLHLQVPTTMKEKLRRAERRRDYQAAMCQIMGPLLMQQSVFAMVFASGAKDALEQAHDWSLVPVTTMGDIGYGHGWVQRHRYRVLVSPAVSPLSMALGLISPIPTSGVTLAACGGKLLGHTTSRSETPSHRTSKGGSSGASSSDGSGGGGGSSCSSTSSSSSSSSATSSSSSGSSATSSSSSGSSATSGSASGGGGGGGGGGGSKCYQDTARCMPARERPHTSDGRTQL